MKRFLAAFLTVIILFSLNSCASRGINQSISYSLNGSPQTLDPQYAKDTSAHIVINNVFEGLVRLSGDGEIIPGIAESWSISPDGLTYTFKLKEGTEWYCSVALKNEFGEDFYKKFSEEKVTANDFVFAMRRAVSPQISSSSAHRLFSIVNAAEIYAGEADVSTLGVTAPDDNTLIISLKEPCDDMLQRLTESVFMPCNEEFFNAMNGRYGLSNRHILCNGPFYVSSWATDSSLTIKRNKYYAGEQEVLPLSVNFSFDFSLDSIGKELAASSVSAALLPPDCVVPENSVVIKENPNSVFGFSFNCSDSLLKNANLRLALCSSIDRGLFGELENAVPQSGFVPMNCTSGGENYRKTIGSQTPKVENAPTAAAEYWNAALNELSVSKVSLTVLCPEWLDSAVRNQLQIWQKTLGINLGITVEIKTPQEITDAVNSGNYQIALTGVESSYDNAVDFFASFRDGGIFKFSSEEYTAIIERLLTVEDKQELIGGCFTAESFILQQGIFYPLYGRSSSFVCSDEVEGITICGSESTVSFIGAKRFD